VAASVLAASNQPKRFAGNASINLATFLALAAYTATTCHAYSSYVKAMASVSACKQS
jgi:hypothetical protein